MDPQLYLNGFYIVNWYNKILTLSEILDRNKCYIHNFLRHRHMIIDIMIERTSTQYGYLCIETLRRENILYFETTNNNPFRTRSEGAPLRLHIIRDRDGNDNYFEKFQNRYYRLKKYTNKEGILSQRLKLMVYSDGEYRTIYKKKGEEESLYYDNKKWKCFRDKYLSPKFVVKDKKNSNHVNFETIAKVFQVFDLDISNLRNKCINYSKFISIITVEQRMKNNKLYDRNCIRTIAEYI